MSKLIKCDCGGTYRDGSVRHFLTSKHIKYLEQVEQDNDRYNDVIVLLITEKFQCDDRMEKAKQYLDKKLDGATDKKQHLKDIKDSLLKKKHMTTQA